MMIATIIKILETYSQLINVNTIDEYEIYLSQLYDLQNEFDRHSAIKYQEMMKDEKKR